MFMIQFSPMSLLRFAVVRSQAERLGFMIFSTYLNTDKDCCAQKEMTSRIQNFFKKGEKVYFSNKKNMLKLNALIVKTFEHKF